MHPSQGAESIRNATVYGQIEELFSAVKIQRILHMSALCRLITHYYGIPEPRETHNTWS